MLASGGSAVACMGQVIQSCKKITYLLYYTLLLPESISVW